MGFQGGLCRGGKVGERLGIPQLVVGENNDPRNGAITTDGATLWCLPLSVRAGWANRHFQTEDLSRPVVLT